MSSKIEKLIKTTLDWQPLSLAVGRNNKKFLELVEEYGAHGVYQVALKEELPEDIISESIGYVGKSENIFGRIYEIKTGRHTCRTYLKSKGIDLSNVCYRILFTEMGNESELERLIHTENEQKFGYRFKWKEASGGNDGAIIRIIEAIDKLESLEDLKTIAKHVDDKASILFLETWKNEE